MMRWCRRQGYFSRIALAMAVACLLAAQALAGAPAAAAESAAAIGRAVIGAPQQCVSADEQRRHAEDCPTDCLACTAAAGGSPLAAPLVSGAAVAPLRAAPTRPKGRASERMVHRRLASAAPGSPRAPPFCLS